MTLLPALLLLTGLLHLYQHFLIIPSDIWLAMWVFGLIYLFLAYKTHSGRALKAVIFFPAIGMSAAIISVLQGKMSLLPWTLLFILIDIAVILLSLRALQARKTLYAKREPVETCESETLETAFAALSFDHLLFTGSTRAGKAVAEAAAKNLTPVTLELGGKSPALILDDANLPKAAASIVFGKLFNAGQTCISPDYVLISETKRDEFIQLLQVEIAKQFQKLENNPDYTRMINARFAARMRGLLVDAKAKGARVVAVNPANETLSETCIAPHLVMDTTPEMLMMQEEIFGSLLVLKTANFAESLAYITQNDRPLSLYIYGHARVDEALSRLVAGGVTVNDCIWHMAQEGQPFGGIGASGQGAYHGKIGFKTFSHMMPVFTQGFINAAPMLRPPYGKNIALLLTYLRKFG